MPTDLKMTEQGDLVIGPHGDFETVSGDDYYLQEVLFRLKTTPGDWLLDPTKGTNLEQFIGQPNTIETCYAVTAEVERALAGNGFMTTAEIRTVPLDETTLFILVEFPSTEQEGRIVQIQSSLDLRKGIVFARTGFRG